MLLALGLFGTIALAAPTWEPPDKQVPAFNVGIEAFNQHRWGAAIAAFQRVVKAEPDCGLALYMLGSAQAAAGESAAAIETLTAARTAFPGREDIDVQAADVLFVLQRFEEAADAAHAALKVAPTSVSALVMSVRADVRLNRTEAALTALDQLAGQQDAGLLACQRILVLENAHREAEARDVLGTCRTSTLPDVVAEAESRLAGIDDIEDAATALGAEGLSMSMRAVSLMNKGMLAEAEVLLREVLDENPDDAIARVNRATCLYRLDHKGDALKELQRLFSAGTWVRREQNGSISGIITSRGADELEIALRQSLASLVRVLLEGGDVSAAQEAQAKAEQRFGRTGPLITSAASLEFAAGASGWDLVAPLLADASPEDPAWNLVGEQAFAHPGAVPALVSTAIVERGTDLSRYNLAAGRANAKDYPGCLVVVSAITDLAKVDNVNLGYRCAIKAADDATVNTWRERAKRAGAIRFPDAYEDAVRAMRSEDWSGAMQRLNLAVPTTAEETSLANDVSVVALVGLGQLEQAIKVSREPGVRPESVYNLGVALQRAGREDEAVATVKQACVGATGELRDLCKDALAR